MDSVFSPTDYNETVTSATCADILVSYLRKLNIPFVFGVPGGNIDFLCSALARSEKVGGPRWILTRSEQGAGFMADGYSRESGRLGVCCSTSGPGATNLITPVCNAYVDGTPLLVITAQTAIASFGRGGMQEASGSGLDIMTMFSGCTRYNSLISHPDQLLRKLFAATNHALGSTPGPVHISIPSDILATHTKNDGTLNQIKSLLHPEFPPEPSLMAMVNSIIRETERGAIVVGVGCEDAMPQIKHFALLKQWPVVTIPMARGLISHEFPLFRGVFGTAGHETARRTLLEENTNLILVAGADLDENATCGWDGSTLLSNRIIHVNSNPEQLARSHMAKLNVPGSPRLVFEALIDDLTTGPVNPLTGPGELEEAPGHMGKVRVLHTYDVVKDSSPVNPRRFFWFLSQLVPPETKVFADAGNSFFWAIHYWRQKYPEQMFGNHLRISPGYASMGWAIGASIGTKMASPDLPVACITGDGSYLMNSQELTVARQQSVNLVMIVLNDACLGTVRHGQRLRNTEDTANKLPDVDYALVARGMGIEGYRIKSMDDLHNLDIPSLFHKDRPVLLDVLIDPDVAPPIGQRIKTLKSSDFKR